MAMGKILVIAISKMASTLFLVGVALKSIEDERGNIKSEETSLEADTEVPYFIIPKKENHMGTKNVSKSQKVK